MFRHFASKCKIKLHLPRYLSNGSKEPAEPTQYSPGVYDDERLSNCRVKFINDSQYVWDPKNETRHCDVLIIGGGGIGSSVAYWLNQRAYKQLKVTVVEKDCTYRKSSTALSVGGLRQQFSIKENIQMSLYGAEFIRNINEHLGIPGEPNVDVDFHPCGYLMLASEAGADTLEKNSELQNALGARNVILTKSQLEQRFPWLNTQGVALGCLGLEKEGWFDPWSLLLALKRKAIHLGTEYINGEVKALPRELISRVRDFEGHPEDYPDGYQKLNRAVVETPEGKIINILFSMVVIAAGASSGEVARLAGIGTGIRLLSVALPVERRKRYVYCFHCPEETGINTPLTIDPSGTYFRKEDLAGNYICGRSPSSDDEPPVDNLDVDHDYFYEKLWPHLARRVKAFENLKVKSAWAGYYEYNTFDKNGIIGRHCYYTNMLFATGFSGHGIQQAPAVGRAITELILDNSYRTIDLENFGFERLLKLEPMQEINIV